MAAHDSTRVPTVPFAAIPFATATAHTAHASHAAPCVHVARTVHFVSLSEAEADRQMVRRMRQMRREWATGWTVGCLPNLAPSTP